MSTGGLRQGEWSPCTHPKVPTRAPGRTWRGGGGRSGGGRGIAADGIKDVKDAVVGDEDLEFREVEFLSPCILCTLPDEGRHELDSWTVKDGRCCAVVPATIQNFWFFLNFQKLLEI